MTTTQRCIILLLAMLPFMGTVSAQVALQRDTAPLRNWAAPLYWQPTESEANATEVGSNSPRMRANAVAAPTNLPLGSNALVFVAMTPCRVVDTRASAGFPAGFGLPHLTGGVARTFAIQSSTTCSIPTVAQAYSFNVTVVPLGPLGFLTMYPAGQPLPLAATLNALQGQVVANAAIVPAGIGGSVNAYATNNTDIVIDINGYYAPSSDSNFNTAVGNLALGAIPTGSRNTATGYSALRSTTSGFGNTANGYNALSNNTTGSRNIAIGRSALVNNTTGAENVALGYVAGFNLTTGDFNILIANEGTASDSRVIRIGTPSLQTTFFAAGVRGVTTGLANAVPVFIDSNGQLGTASSSRRFKEDISDMGNASSGLLSLRPVTFRYKKAYADGSKSLDYGLIAEEVAEVFPDLVVKGADAQIETVQYQKLTPMLLNELQKEHQHTAKQDETIKLQQERIRSLEDRLASLEALLTGGVRQ